MMDSVRLADVCSKIGSGATPRGGADVYQEHGVALIRSQNVHNGGFRDDGLVFLGDEQARGLDGVAVQAGDVLLNITGDSVARACEAPSRVGAARVNQHVAIIRPDPRRLNARFLRYFLVSPGMQAHMLALASAGATRNALTKGMIEDFRVPSPPMGTQRAIAHILGSLDDKIDLNRRMNETLEALARAIFKSWFVGFDPVRAKMAGRQPVGMDAETAALFPDRMQDSEIGEIPAGWSVGPILDIAKLLSGGTPKTDRDEYWNGGIPWASAKDVSQAGQTFLVDTERTITGMGLDESATQVIPAFATVVVARGATTGRMVLFGRDMAMNQTCYALVSTVGTPFALYSQLRAEMEGLVLAAHGSVFDTITTSTFAASKVVIPDRRLLDAFDHACRPLFLRILSGSNETRSLAALRDALLPKLLSGELRIPDAEKMAEATL